MHTVINVNTQAENGKQWSWMECHEYATLYESLYYAESVLDRVICAQMGHDQKQIAMVINYNTKWKLINSSITYQKSKKI